MTTPKSSVPDLQSSDNFSFIPTFLHQRHSFVCLNVGYRPKSLPDYDYSAILYGEVGPENYSPDCWLEEHLHRFSGFSVDQSNTANGLDESSSSCGEVEVVSDFSDHSFIDSDASNLQCFYQYQPDGLMDVESPPPYWDEPPPTYEEATRSEVSEREFSPFSLTHVNHVSDWMWWHNSRWIFLGFL